MDYFELLKKRKAIRQFEADKTIPKKDIDKIVEYTNLAPSARNLQGYKIFIIQKKAIIKIFPCFYNQRSDFIKNASIILIFCLDPEMSEKQFGERGKNLYSLQDATIAATFAMLTATALGYATCWVGNFDELEVKRVLKTSLRPVASIIVGYSKENPNRPERNKAKTISEIITS